MEQYANNMRHIEGDIWTVPCIANFPGNFFQPLYQPSSMTESFTKSNGWSKIEDNVLNRLITQRGAHQWGIISKEFNAIIGKHQIGKTPRECRERWSNHLNPILKKGQWTRQEDISILSLYLEQGKKWSYIAKQLQGRTAHSVKNRWTSLTNKAQKHWPGHPNPIEKLLGDMILIQESSGINE